MAESDTDRKAGRPRRAREVSDVVTLRLAPAELAWIDGAAQQAGQTRSEWARAVLLAAARGPVTAPADPATCPHDEVVATLRGGRKCARCGAVV